MVDPLRKNSEGAAGADYETGDIYRLLVESVQDYAIFALDRTGHVLSWNPGAQRFKGYTAEEIIGKHFSTFYPPETPVDFTQYELDVAARAGSFIGEGWRVRKDGSRFWAYVVITALRNDSGELVGFGKVTRDLTERKLAEEAIRESEARFRLLVTSVKDYGIFMLDPEGKIASWNDGAERIKGYSAEEAIGQSFSIFYPEVDKRAGKPAYELEVAAAVGRFEDEGWRIRKDGSRFWANVVITALRAESGTLIGFSKVTRDLTERRAAEQRALEDARRIAAEEAARAAAQEYATEMQSLVEQLKVQAAELNAQREEAEKANRAKSDFLAAMSHELRTPLNAIGGFTELISMEIRGPVTSEQHGDLNRIKRSQQHLLGIINDILNFSRLQAGHLSYDTQNIAIGELVEAVTPMIELQAAAKGLTFEPGVCPPDLIIAADRSKVEQILLNLLSNSVKFTLAGGKISMDCERSGNDVLMHIRDNGIGIPEEKIAAIFDPFVQVGRTLTTTAEGTGLGLAISRDLARAMHGDLTVESTLGKGSVFTLALPTPSDDMAP